MATWVKPTGDTAMCGRSVFSHLVAAVAPAALAVAGRCSSLYHSSQVASWAKSLGREKTTTMPSGDVVRRLTVSPYGRARRGVPIGSRAGGGHLPAGGVEPRGARPLSLSGGLVEPGAQ